METLPKIAIKYDKENFKTTTKLAVDLFRDLGFSVQKRKNAPEYATHLTTGNAFGFDWKLDVEYNSWVDSTRCDKPLFLTMPQDLPKLKELLGVKEERITIPGFFTWMEEIVPEVAKEEPKDGEIPEYVNIHGRIKKIEACDYDSYNTTEGFGFASIEYVINNPSTKEAYEAQQVLKDERFSKEIKDAGDSFSKKVREDNELIAKIKELEDENEKLKAQANKYRTTLMAIAFMPDIADEVKKSITE